ncbi:tetratricopeptide repeat protein [Flavobacterium sp. TP390]|uniref:Tetratricopeptide repeat protein n=1 Tax=Flavobacterium profundi TaxID=1774945 RepID=A0A6I4IS98_9FLAO|nr:tetratricopeptide repeat protein [Flavobacterium profundi]MVO08657.1 tetratricopeptide repeat protein [Flavobacterium profundi]
MKNKIVGILIAIGILSSCKNETKNKNKTELDNKVRIEFTDQKGNRISKEEIENATGTYNYEFYGIEGVSDLAKSLHNQARQFGQTGDYQKAIALLEQANKEAPNWAYPLYDLAYTYLLQDDYENALKYYKLTDQVAPKGFYTSKTALHTLEREKSGELQKGLYKYYLYIEWISNESEKREMIELFVEKFPSFAPAWKEYSKFLEGQERINAIEKGLEQKPDIETKGVLLINKALAINKNGEFENATKILTSVIFDPNSTYGNIEMAKFVLHNISKE